MDIRRDEVNKAIMLAKRHYFKGRLIKAQILIKEYAERCVPSALYWISLIPNLNESQEEYESRHIHQLVKSADSGYLPAIYRLAVYKESGNYVSQDGKGASELFALAAKGGHPQAQWSHGMNILNQKFGNIGRQEEGLEYLKRAGEQGIIYAQEMLVEIYQQGSFGIKRDSTQKLYWQNKLESGENVTLEMADEIWIDRDEQIRGAIY